MDDDAIVSVARRMRLVIFRCLSDDELYNVEDGFEREQGSVQVMFKGVKATAFRAQTLACRSCATARVGVGVSGVKTRVFIGWFPFGRLDQGCAREYGNSKCQGIEGPLFN